MLTEHSPDRLSISGVQVSSDNGLTNVSLMVSIKDTEHKSLFSFEPLILREGYAAISLLIPFLNPMSSIAAVNIL